MLLPVYLTLMLPQKQLPRGILLGWLSEFGDKKNASELVGFGLIVGCVRGFFQSRLGGS
jgi:hypothetical protein